MEFRAYACCYLTDRRADGLRATTAHRYECMLRDDILPVVGCLELRKIKPAHVRDVLQRMRTRGLSASTVTQARAVFRGIMQQAVADSLIETNPVTAIKRPKVSRPDKAVPTPAQVKTLIESSKGTVMEIAIIIGATTGLRRSETSGLLWSDIDLANARVNVRRGLQWVPVSRDDRGCMRRELQFTDLKTDEAHRTVGLMPFVVERLRLHRKEQMERRLALGEAWNATHGDVVSDRGDGRPLDPDRFTKVFKRLAAEAGLDSRTTLHDLRHAVITQLGRGGVHPLIVSAIPGHTDPAFTMRVYQHAWEEGVDEGVAALSKAFDL
jgi:integrase